MNRNNLETLFNEVSSNFNRDNSQGVMTLEIKEYSKKPSLADISPHYKEKGNSEKELAEFQYREITKVDLQKSLVVFFRSSPTPELRVFADDLARSVLVEEKTECIHIQASSDHTWYMLSILSGSGKKWNLLDFCWQFD